MNVKFVQALLEWSEGGDRCVDIKFDNSKFSKKLKVKIWCYSYEITNGKYVSCIEDIPTDEELSKEVLEKHEKEYKRILAKQKKSGLRPLS